MFIRPGEHPEDAGARRKVRVPHTFTLLPEEGAEVPENAFWLRRLAQGDVVLADPPAAAEASPAPPLPLPEEEDSR